MVEQGGALAGTEIILLAGGLGTRLRETVRDLPKPMAPIAGRPFLEYLLGSLQGHSFTRAVLAVGYRAHAIRDFFGDRFGGMELVYCQEDEPLGTGGAIRAAARQCTTDLVFIVNADTLATVDYAAMLAQHRAARAGLSLALIPVADTARYGAVQIERSSVRSFEEKGRTGPGYINAGVYLMQTGLLEGLGLPDRFSFEQEVLSRGLDRLKPAVFFASGYFLDIGIPEDYERARRELPGLDLHNLNLHKPDLRNPDLHKPGLHNPNLPGPGDPA